MVLISIRPFAVRKMLLIALALLGFSAVCFADPVLVARRYNRNLAGVAAARRVEALAFKAADATDSSSGSALFLCENNKVWGVGMGAHYLFVRPEDGGFTALADMTKLSLLPVAPTER